MPRAHRRAGTATPARRNPAQALDRARLLAELSGPARMPPPGAPSGADRADTWTFGTRFRRVLARAARVVAIAGQIPFGWLAAIPRRLGDRLFAMNDAEAYWYGRQVTRTHGGLGRRYRDPQFCTLAECPEATSAERSEPHG